MIGWAAGGATRDLVDLGLKLSSGGVPSDTLDGVRTKEAMTTTKGDILHRPIGVNRNDIRTAFESEMKR